MKYKLWEHLQTVKNKSPLVHNITNYVAMNNTANALLAVGASPIMAYAKSEVKDMVTISDALVVNIGTLDEYWVESMVKAAEHSAALQKPWILDPVGVGATAFRDEIAQKLSKLNPTIIRGNASEIFALAQANQTKTKGVDSTATSLEAREVAIKLARELETIVCVSGEKDIVTDGKTVVYITNGHPLMTKITGMGCSATAIIGAFASVIDHKLEATAAAMTLLGIVGEIAAKSAKGPGSLQTQILDKLYTLTENEFLNYAKLSSDS